MPQVDTLLVGGVVLTMNGALDLYRDGAVAIKGDQIVAVGPAGLVQAEYTADEVIDCRGKIVMPGLVNAHTHVPMTLLRAIADDLRLDVWLMGYMMPTEREFVTPEFCRLGTKLACAEMIRGGTTLFADMYYYEADVAAATAEVGLRALCGESILKFPTPDADSYDESLAYTREFIEQWKGHPLIVPCVAPHAPYTTTDEILRACADLAVEYDVPLQVHLAETRLEVDESWAQFEKRVVTRVADLGVFNAKTLAAHCVHVDSEEIRLLHKHGASVAHNPSSNLKLASGIAPVVEMLERGVKVAVGTDGPASNNDLDMFEEVRLAALLAKGATFDPTALPAKQALLLATRQGAEAVYMGDITGSLEPGKRADVIVVDHAPLHNSPHFERDPDSVYSQIVYASHSSDVESVMVNGRWLMRDRVLLTVDEAAIRQEAEVVARQIDRFLIAREGNVVNKLVAIGGLQQEESFEIQVKAMVDDASLIERLLQHPAVQLVKHNHYRQYDTYFLFNGEEDGRVRYREDDFIDEQGNVTANVRTRLTYTIPEKAREFDEAVLLSHSRFIAPADRPLRFYREYFQALKECEVHKDRMRWHVLYKGVLFYVNLDQMILPEAPERYIEIKSRTWSQRDAEYKAGLTSEILNDVLGIPAEARVRMEYVDLCTMGA
ncbi:amidohydrolase family protein [Aggregatilinea lenta]|uniref:amidohydrolase family protein n=1 Tax=Aggregatilinea lenta TaxID=913108 RepID=UPI000E5A39C1|nr:amidohydrolase [Aggregatilinea lenta]